MIVMKFGGSSVADAGRIRHVVGIVKASLDKKPVLVFSAMGKTTDNIILSGKKALEGVVDISDVRGLVEKTSTDLGVDPPSDLLDELESLLKGISLIKEITPKTNDYLVSFGERISVRIISAYLNKVGVEAKYHDAWDIGFTTNSDFGNAEILKESYQKIKESLAEGIHVVTGFIAKDKEGNITTLGRGGSDLTATTIGAALKADEVHVWKDVDGILTADPKIVGNASPVKSLSFEEASELAYFGAKVLHPISMIPVMKENIPVRVKNSYNTDHPGTLISNQPSTSLVRAITSKRSVVLVDIASNRMLGQYGFLAEVFNVFKQAKVSVDMIATSEVSISLTLDSGGDVSEVEKALEKIATVSIRESMSIISIIGDVKKSSEILGKAFTELHRNGINVQMVSQGASKVNMGFIVDGSQTETCIKHLHNLFFDNV